jgi:dTDP-glucose pyrophosphorylase
LIRALVLARGLGTRMRTPDDVTLDPAQQQAADAGLKAMIPFAVSANVSADVSADLSAEARSTKAEPRSAQAEARSAKAEARPFLDYVLHSLGEAGVRRVGLVLGPEHDDVRAYYRARDAKRLRIDFVLQPEPLGTADAVWSARDWAGTDSFLVLNADNLYPVDVLARLVAADGPALPAFEADSLALPLARLGAFGLIECDAHGFLARVIEKPGEAAVEAAGPKAPISMNVWRFDARIFDACRDVPISTRGEHELPQAVSLAASCGVRFQVFPARGPVLDLSSRADIALVARRLRSARVSL